ncbi:15632_t:CDS:2, partial [Funneliformis mosseae]
TILLDNNVGHILDYIERTLNDIDFEAQLYEPSEGVIIEEMGVIM